MSSPVAHRSPPAPLTPRLVNVSVLKKINAGEILTAGFVIAGSTSKQVLIRAIGPTLGLGEAALRKVLEANMMSLYWLTRAVIPAMLERRAGRIILVASTAGLTGGGASLSYGMSKAAGMNAMQTLAVELGPAGICCNSIAPGLIETDMTRPMMARPGVLDTYLARSPARAPGVPDDIAGVAVFLASRAGAHMSGQTLVVDGGYTIA